MTINDLFGRPPLTPVRSRRWFLAVAGASAIAAACSRNDSTADNVVGSTTPSSPNDQPAATTSTTVTTTDTTAMPTTPTTADTNSDATNTAGPIDVAIVGAGAAGLTAAHLLDRRGLRATVFEASASHGGRMRTADDFVDFPVSLGAEWLTAPESELTAIVDDPSVAITSRLERYDPTAPSGYYNGAELVVEPLGEFDYLNFADSSWLDLFDDHVVDSVPDQIRFNTQIVEVDYTDTPVRLTTADGAVHSAEHVIITAPLAVLQRGDINFVPPLPHAKQAALDAAVVWGGVKIFVEFAERFYPTFVEFNDSDTATGQRTYYDAAAHHNSDSNVIGLFAVGSAAEPYQALEGDQLRNHVLAELDEVFDGAASRAYVSHVVQDWSAEPFIGQAYLNDYADPAIPAALASPLDGRVFFAGDAYTTHDDWGGVDDATQSARDAVARIVG